MKFVQKNGLPFYQFSHLARFPEVQHAVFTRNGREVVFADIAVGDCFGEVAALDGGERTASVVALTPVTVAALPGAALAPLLDARPEISRALLRLLCAKLRHASSRLAGLAELSAPQRVRVRPRRGMRLWRVRRRLFSLPARVARHARRLKIEFLGVAESIATQFRRWLAAIERC